MPKFIGRKDELNKLIKIAEKKTASFILVRGRRRIGKSRLIEEYGKHFDKFYTFAGLAPTVGMTAKHQLEEFNRQISQQFRIPLVQYGDWSDALLHLAERVKSEKTLLFFDEISWMGSEDPTFLSKIKNFWDQHLKKNNRLVFVLCGSASAWIEKNILSSTGFVGRISYTLTLDELSLSECSLFWPKNISAYEKLKVLSITGGIPKYLEEMSPKISAEDNIRNLCFLKGAPLVNEFNQIFSDLFLRDSVFYKKITDILIDGAKERGEICKLLNIDTGGRISDYLFELELAGFITRDHTWNISSGADSKLSKYRLRDNYLRFYLKYIDKNLSKINRNIFRFKSIASLPEWSVIMGYQFENLVLNNRRLLHKALQINEEEIICENPFYQHKTYNQSGCQIDYMIQMKYGTLYICEIKFSKNKIDSSIVPEMIKKIDALRYPKRFSCRPVLIHVNGVTDDVVDSDYFASIVDVSQFLEG
jgi:AAA+ ATPase superfamily predicted ATPase